MSISLTSKEELHAFMSKELSDFLRRKGFPCRAVLHY